MKTVIRPETEMKESGIKWVGLMPVNWKTVRIKNLPNQEENSFVDGDWIESSYITDSGIRYYTTGNIGDGKFKEQGNGYISENTFNELKCKYAFPGDLVLSRLNEPYGRSCIIPETEPKCIVAVDNVILRTHEDKRYICYITQCDGYHAEVGELARGTAMKRVSRTNLGTIRIPLPAKIEQQAIADYLDETCSKIDEIIAEAKASINEYKELKQSVIFEAVTKGLDKNVEMKDSGVEWIIGKVNNKYNVVKIAELNDGLTDGTHGTYKRFDSGKLLLSSKNVQHNGLVIGSNESYISEEDSNAIVANGFPQKDDLLLCCIGASIGRCILYPFDYPIAFQRSVIFIRCNKWILPKMMMYNLQSISSLMQEQMVVNVSAQAGLYQGLVKQLYIVVPPIDEQKQIILLLDKKTAEIDSLITEKESLINDLEAYKKSLIYEVVTGKRRVV